MTMMSRHDAEQFRLCLRWCSFRAQERKCLSDSAVDRYISGASVSWPAVLDANDGLASRGNDVNLSIARCSNARVWKRRKAQRLVRVWKRRRAQRLVMSACQAHTVHSLRVCAIGKAMS